MERPTKNFNDDLISAIKNHDNSKAKELILRLDDNSKAKELNTIDNAGRTLLHFAASFNNSAIIQYLITYVGCQVDAKDAEGDTPLMMAVFSKSENAIKTLLNARAKVPSFNTKSGQFLISLLKYKSRLYVRILRMLLDSVVCKSRSSNEKVLKLLDLHCPFPLVVILANAQVTRAMLKMNSSVNERLPKTRETALHLAVRFLDIEHVKVLVNSGADLEARDFNNLTPLLRFKMRANDVDEKIEVLRFLLDKGASLYSKMENGRAVASELLRTGDKRIVKILMKRVNLFSRDKYGDIFLHDLAYNKNPGVFDILKEMTFDVNERDQVGQTLLDIAIANAEPEKVQYLLENGADINNVDYSDNITVLRWVLDGDMHSPGMRKVIELLLQHGMNAHFALAMCKTMLDYISSSECDSVKPILAHLAMTESFDGRLMTNVYADIESVEAFQKYFDSCKKNIEEMKGMTVLDSVKLYDLLRVNQKNIDFYINNPDFLSEYAICIQNNKDKLDPYYLSTLQSGIGKAVNLAIMDVSLITRKIAKIPTRLSSTVVS